MGKSILVFDPGESTGWVYRDNYDRYIGGTCKKNHKEVANVILRYSPEIVVLERFNLYPQMAKSLAWNSFYPCEVIGVIKYLCMHLGIPCIEQAPSVKKYYGGVKEDWNEIKKFGKNITEHTKDAYMHFKYFERNGLKRFQEG